MKDNECIAERCQICGKTMTKIKNILVWEDKDKYICKSCASKYGLEVSRCTDFDEE